MIYFIQHGDDGPVKIGMVNGRNVNSVGDRLASLQGSNPQKLRLLGYCQGGKREEILLHNKMRPFRVSGEWFELRSELVEVIKKLSAITEQENILYEETVSIDELVRRLQDEFNWDVYYKDLSKFVVTNKKIPSHKVFGKKRYKYEECRKYFSKGCLPKYLSTGRD